MGVASPAPTFEYTLADLVDAEGGEAGALDRLARSGKINKPRFLDVLHRDIDSAIRDLEADRKSHCDSNEDLMSRIIVGQLKARGYDAQSDVNDAGHVDIHVQSTRLNLKWFGESKIHNGYEVGVDGVRQLLTRYASGYDTDGGFIYYVREANAANVATTFRAEVANDSACRTIRTADGSVVYRFSSTHEHSAGTEYSVRHHIVLMHHDPKDKSARAVATRKVAKANATKAAAMAAPAAMTGNDDDDDDT